MQMLVQARYLLKKLYGKLEVILYCDINHTLVSDYSIVRYMDSGFQSVDMAVANEAKKLLIIVKTQDFGVAAMVLGKRAHAIGPKGFVYTNENIDKVFFPKTYCSPKVRRSGGKTSNPKKRTREDDEKIIYQFN